MKWFVVILLFLSGCNTVFSQELIVPGKYTIFLTGASFASPENGWFELGCKELDATPLNRAIGGEAIANSANKMAEGKLYTKKELDTMDAFVIMQVHDKDVFDESQLKEKYTDYKIPFDRTNYAAAYDYVIKRYISDCYNLKFDKESKYFGSVSGKPAVIVLSTHWHDARAVYNASIRKLAGKWGLPLIEFDKYIGFSKNSIHPVTGQQFGLLYAQESQKSDTIECGWHPQQGKDKYIQQRMASIFMDVMKKTLPCYPTIAASREHTYTNPLPVKFGDPYVLLASDGRYYMYGTGGGAVDGFCAYSSSDLVSWKPEGQVYRGNTPESWTVANFWAPEVYERNGKYYMFFSADWKENPNREKENFRIGVAVSDKPTGPFREVSDGPLFDPGYPVIDGNIIEDTDGRVYMYFSRCCYKHPVKSDVAIWAKKQGLFNEIEESWIYGIEIKPDFTGVIGKPVLLLRPPVKSNDTQAEWESRSVTSGEVNRRWTEGSYTLKKGDTFYMMYSANYFGGKNYAVGYATSKKLLGPYIKSPDNPVLEKNVEKGGIVTGTGHNSVTWSKDRKQMYCVYHGRTQSTGDERVVFIDKMGIDEQGRLYVEGPTTTPQEIK